MTLTHLENWQSQHVPWVKWMVFANFQTSPFHLSRTKPKTVLKKIIYFELMDQTIALGVYDELGVIKFSRALAKWLFKPRFRWVGREYLSHVWQQENYQFISYFSPNNSPGQHLEKSRTPVKYLKWLDSTTWPLGYKLESSSRTLTRPPSRNMNTTSFGSQL